MREVRIRDTLSGELRAVEPGPGGAVGIYACGPTVYSRIHVGNARPFVVFMLLHRFLAHEGYAPKLVINVTDINDKIYDAARAQEIGSAELAEGMTNAYIEDTDRLGLGRPDAEPLASATLTEIVALIEDLIASGHAYESGGDVYFRVRSFERYGALSNRDADQMDQGEEAGSAELKQDPLDFALWKARKPGEDTGWPSPWGGGRPGWHIECSALDENEIAQTEAARGETFARIWMHNGMVETAQEKMAKSEGNVFQLSEAIERFGAEAVVGFLVAGHYRQPIAFGEDALEQARARNERLRDFFRGAERVEGEDDPRVAEAREAFLD